MIVKTFLNAAISGGLLLLSASLHAGSVNYNFEDTIPSGIVVENVPASVSEGVLYLVIDEASQKWTARIFITINQDIFENPVMVLRYRVGTPQAGTTAQIPVTLKIDDQYTQNGDAGTWRLYPRINLSSEWQETEIDLSPLISSWESNHGASHGNIQEVRIDIGNNNEPFVSDTLFLDYIRLGDHLGAHRLELNPDDRREIVVDLGVPATGSPTSSNFTVTRDGVEQVIDSVFFRDSSTLVIALGIPVEVPREVLELPLLELSYNGADEISDAGNSLLTAFRREVSFTAYAEDLWKYWGTFEKVDRPVKAPWVAENAVSDGWDWSLPEFVEADSLAYFRYKNSPNLDFSCKNLNSVYVSWNELEPGEGQYDFELLRQRIIQNSNGYDGVVLRVLASVWEIESYPEPGGYVPTWLQERKNAPRWMNNLDIAKIRAHKAIDGKYIITNMDIMDPDYHGRYLKFLEEFGKSGIPRMDQLKIVNVCYRSASAGEEFTAYNPGHNAVEALYSAETVSQRTKERLKGWVDAFGNQRHKLMYVGHDEKACIEYAGELGIGSRQGFIEMYNSYVHMPQFGITINPLTRYGEVDENNHFIKKDVAFGDENEEYDNELRFGWKESFPYRYYISSFRMLQMRRNYVMHAGNTLNPELTWYVGLGLARKVEDTPDAWALLSEFYLSPWANGGNAGPIKNIERWLYQRDVTEYETTPAMQVPTAKDLWYADDTRPYDFTARKGKKMAFDVDDRLFPDGEQAMAIKLSYYDGVSGTLKLVYENDQGIQEDSVVTSGTDQVRTATFFITARMDTALLETDSLEFDFELHSTEEVPVFFVRVIRTETSYENTDQLPFEGRARTIPGFIECEHYDIGDEGFAFHDDTAKEGDSSQRPLDNVDIIADDAASNGYAVGYTSDGEWLEYTVDAAPGNYDITLYYYCGTEPGDLIVSLESNVLDTLGGMENQGWDQRDSVTRKNVPVSGGEDNILRLEFTNGAGIHLDAIQFTRSVVAVTGVSLSGCPLNTLAAGDSVQLMAEVGPADAADRSVTWSSSDPSVAQVDSIGFVTAVSAGTALISVTTSHGGFTGQCLITIDSGVSKTDRIADRAGNVDVFPNPVSEKLYFRFQDPGAEKRISIYSAFGQLLVSQYTCDTSLEVDVGKFNSKALFIVQVISGGKAEVFKIVVED